MNHVNPDFIQEMQAYGAFDITSCFNCGNCTAVCPLSQDDTAFPRKLIRYAHLGLTDKLLQSKDMWMCYYCGECSETCPRQAEPGAFMASLRRYAMARQDVTGLTSRLYKSAWFNGLFMTVIAVILGLFMYGQRLADRGDTTIIEVFNIPFAFIHTLGIVVMSVAALALLVGLVRMGTTALDLRNIVRLAQEKKVGFAWMAPAVKEAWKVGTEEMLAFKRFRECDQETEEKRQVPLLLKPWFLHAATAWGFFGLFAATLLDFLLKDPERLVSIVYPTRLLGTVAGLFLMYGTSMILGKRLRGREKSYAHTVFSDWWFLGTLWFIGLTGFLLEIEVYFPSVSQRLRDILFILHVAPAIELVVLVAFTKLAHVFYRPMALLAYNLKQSLSRYEKKVIGDQ